VEYSAAALEIRSGADEAGVHVDVSICNDRKGCGGGTHMLP
jgi:hypothetical protein